MDSRLDAARDFVINLFAVEHAGPIGKAVGFSTGGLPSTLKPASTFFSLTASGESQLFAFLGPDR